ncbi:type VII secretion protein [Streptococcus azizii]|uniref:Type VII secretion protein n=1 Tax=Streptococcus azizii TaxID=1579424 RepID=A0AB36JN24_9STRE|nr:MULTISPECIES: type VII secretion protein [Streptococcus]MBF0776989.1 type VII secretion protein [Streptococcus sp. 19428wD3_AN2]ONK25969.1 type VII secretion protein [Streptococcus azizii]ONK26115.1 type VII secretion protein [Streptococcus azizii]ONK26366.1 type VII secretion protein [Streptococcus azizii]TFU81926.1 type VII secretion protein [Streptococcus sp. AN2]
MKRIQAIFGLLLLCLSLASRNARTDDGSLSINNQTIYDQGNSPQTTKSKNIPELFLEDSVNKEKQIQKAQQEKVHQAQSSLFMGSKDTNSFQSQDKVTRGLFQADYKADEAILTGESPSSSSLPTWLTTLGLGISLLSVTYLGVWLGKKYSKVLRFKKENV